MKLIKMSYIRYFFYTLISLIACVFILIISKSILAPLVIATLLSVALHPVLIWIQKLIPSNLLSISLLLLCVILFVCGFFSILIIQLNGFYEDFPNMSGKLSNLLQSIEQYLKTTFNLPNLNIVKFTKENSDEIIKSGTTNSLASIFGGISGFINYIIIIPIYVFLILLYRSQIISILKKILDAFKIKSFTVISQITTLIQSYLRGILIVMLLLAIANSIGLFFLGVPYAFILGFMVAVFAVIPYVGALLGGVIVLFVSYFSQGSPITLLYITILFSAIQFIEGNFLTPKIIGEKVNLNPLIAIVSLLIGGQIWGIVGMVIALPITAILLMISKHIKVNAFHKTTSASPVDINKS